MPLGTRTFRSANRNIKRQYKRRYKAKYGKKGGLAYKAYKEVLKLKSKVPKPEIKHVDVLYSSTALNSGTVTSMIQGLAQGTADDNNRIGDVIKATHLQLKGTITTNSGAANPQFVRLIIWIDHGKNYTMFSDLYDQTGTGQASRGIKRWDRRFETKVIYDVLVALNPNGMEAQVFNVDIPLNHNIVFNAGSSTTINRGDVVLGLIADDALNGPSFVFNSRFLYTDS